MNSPRFLELGGEETEAVQRPLGREAIRLATRLRAVYGMPVVEVRDRGRFGVDRGQAVEVARVVPADQDQAGGGDALGEGHGD